VKQRGHCGPLPEPATQPAGSGHPEAPLLVQAWPEVRPRATRLAVWPSWCPFRSTTKAEGAYFNCASQLRRNGDRAGRRYFAEAFSLTVPLAAEGGGFEATHRCNLSAHP